MALQALLNTGDEVLIPAPGLSALDRRGDAVPAGSPVHYLCDEDEGWQPDLEDIDAKITARHQGPS